MAVGLPEACGMAAPYAIELLPGRYMPLPAWREDVSGQSTCFHVTFPVMRCCGPGAAPALT